MDSQMGSLEDEEDPVVERAFAPHFWIGPARFDSDVLQVEDKPPDFLDKVVIGPAGVPGVLFSCSKCDGIVAGRLMTITSGDSSCPHCGRNVNIAESDPSLEELIKAFIYLGEVRTKDEPELALAFAREVVEGERSRR